MIPRPDEGTQIINPLGWIAGATAAYGDMEGATRHGFVLDDADGG
jgi:hypothetical protein